MGCSAPTPLCLNGGCVECSPNATQCSGSALQICSSSGTWGGAAPCADPNESCTRFGRVHVQQLDLRFDREHTCSGSTVVTCAQDSNNCLYEASETPCSGSTPACLAGAGCVACTPGDTQCSGTDAQTCSSSGTWVTTATCGPNQSCSTASGTARCTCNGSICTSTASVCESTTDLATCAEDSNDCFYVASTTTCTTSCSGGACLPGPDAGVDAGPDAAEDAGAGDAGDSGVSCSTDTPQQCGDAGLCDLQTHDCCALAVLQSSSGGYILVSQDEVCKPKAADGGTLCPTSYSGAPVTSGAASVACAQTCDCNGSGVCCANDNSGQNGGYSGATLCSVPAGGSCPGADAGAVQLCAVSSECANGAQCITQSCTKNLGFGIIVTETVTACGLGSGCTGESTH